MKIYVEIPISPELFTATSIEHAIKFVRSIAADAVEHKLRETYKEQGWREEPHE